MGGGCGERKRKRIFIGSLRSLRTVAICRTIAKIIPALAFDLRWPGLQ